MFIGTLRLPARLLGVVNSPRTCERRTRIRRASQSTSDRESARSSPCLRSLVRETPQVPVRESTGARRYLPTRYPRTDRRARTTRRYLGCCFSCASSPTPTRFHVPSARPIHEAYVHLPSPRGPFRESSPRRYCLVGARDTRGSPHVDGDNYHWPNDPGTGDNSRALAAERADECRCGGGIPAAALRSTPSLST